MEAQELSNNNEEQSRKENINMKKSNRLPKLQSFLILFVTLAVCLTGGYIISDKYLWPDADEQHLIDQTNYYKDLVDAKPNNPENRVNLGYTYYLRGDNEEAIKQLKMALDLDKGDFGAYFNLGLVYLNEERYNDALKQAQKTVELAPQNYKSNLLVGMTYRNLKMYDESLKSLQEALNLSPINTDIINELGKLAEDQGNFDEAEKLYKEALSYDPLYKPATEGLKRLAAETKKKDNK